MPSTEVELDNGDEALGWIVYGWNVQKHFGVAHEATRRATQLVFGWSLQALGGARALRTL